MCQLKTWNEPLIEIETKCYCHGLKNNFVDIIYCRSGNIRKVLIFARRTYSRIQECCEYYYNSATYDIIIENDQY